MKRVPRTAKRAPYRKCWALFHALIHAETATHFLAQEIERLQEEMKGQPPPEGLNYRAPPRPTDDEETRKIIEARRAAAVRPRIFHLKPEDRGRLRAATEGQQDTEELELRSPNRHYFDRFDSYHRAERLFRGTLEEAKLAAVRAAGELDSPRSTPLERVTSHIRLDLQNLGGAVPHPISHGDYPPAERSVPVLMRTLSVPIGEWVNRLRAFLSPEPPAGRLRRTRKRRGGKASATAQAEQSEGNAAEIVPPDEKRELLRHTDLCVQVSRSPDGKKITVLELFKGELLRRAEISGPVLCKLFRLVERLCAERVGSSLVPWEDVRQEWLEERKWKGTLTSERTLRDYGLRIKGALEDRALGHCWDQPMQGGVRWRGTKGAV